MSAPAIDLNCDIGESYGAWTMGDDEALMPLVSSANIACGFHAGDPQTMRRTVEVALQHGVAIGAHVSLPDLQGFGRREMKVSSDEVYALTVYQIGALSGFAAALGARLSHVKPHGALYNMAARDVGLAAAIARAVHAVDPELLLYGLAGSVSIGAAEHAGLIAIGEAFADRRYEADGKLTPRGIEGALIDDPESAAIQALGIAQFGELRARNGELLQLSAQTICLHGDRSNAAEFARRIRAHLDAAGIAIRAPAGKVE